MARMRGAGRQTSKTAIRAFQALELLTRKGQPVSAARIAELLDVDRMAAQRSLKTLCSVGLAVQDAKTHNYRASLRLLSLTRKLALNQETAAHVDEALNRIAESTGETCRFEVLEGANVVVVQRVFGRFPSMFDFDVGEATPAYCTSTGKAILAFQPRSVGIDLIKDELPKLTSRTITDAPTFVQALDVARSEGFAIDDREFLDDLRCVAAPIINLSGTANSALAACGPIERFTMEYTHQLGALLRDEAARLSDKLKNSPLLM